MWLVILSDQLPVIGLGGRYLPNYLMGRRLVPERLLKGAFPLPGSCGISDPFGSLFPTPGWITHVLLTRLPLSPILLPASVRLACVRYAASVHPEPGSNSPFDFLHHSQKINVTCSHISSTLQLLTYCLLQRSGIISSSFVLSNRRSNLSSNSDRL